jgi:hypothetical protein
MCPVAAHNREHKEIKILRFDATSGESFFAILIRRLYAGHELEAWNSWKSLSSTPGQGQAGV